MTAENSLPPFEKNSEVHFTQSVDPNWKPGSGANNDEWKSHKKVSFEPYSENRSPFANYRLLTDAITPRPIAFVSSVSPEGVRNLAPFSYFQVVNSDPPIFVIGISKGRGVDKDTAANVLATKELTINIISEWFIDAANYSSIDAPSDVDEWKLTGLTPLESVKVKPPHVAESAFTIEAKLITHHEWTSKVTGAPSGTLLIVEGINFHAREDIIGDNFSSLDFSKLKPVSRLGGPTYGRTTQLFDLGRLEFDVESEKPEVKKALESSK